MLEKQSIDDMKIAYTDFEKEFANTAKEILETLSDIYMFPGPGENFEPEISEKLSAIFEKINDIGDKYTELQSKLYDIDDELDVSKDLGIHRLQESSKLIENFISIITKEDIFTPHHDNDDASLAILYSMMNNSLILFKNSASLVVKNSTD